MDCHCNCSSADVRPSDLAGMIDVSAVQTQSSWEDACKVLEVADKYNCSAVFLLGEMTRRIAPELKKVNARRVAEGKKAVKLGGVTGFPDGGSLTEVKVAEAAKMVEIGCDEIDCVMNVGLALSGDWDGVEKDLRAIRAATAGKTLKVILECPYLNDEQIATAAQIASRAGADWIKTSTGWPDKNKTSVAHIETIRKAIGPDGKIKAAGGIRNAESLLALYHAGARLFGISWSSVVRILEEK